MLDCQNDGNRVVKRARIIAVWSNRCDVVEKPLRERLVQMAALASGDVSPRPAPEDTSSSRCSRGLRTQEAHVAGMRIAALVGSPFDLVGLMRKT
jgi:hypothetical protein